MSVIQLLLPQDVQNISLRLSGEVGENSFHHNICSIFFPFLRASDLLIAVWGLRDFQTKKLLQNTTNPGFNSLLGSFDLVSFILIL